MSEWIIINLDDIINLAAQTWIAISLIIFVTVPVFRYETYNKAMGRIADARYRGV